MSNELQTKKVGALSRLESRSERVPDQNDPDYWFYVLESTGKLNQSPALVREAIEKSPESERPPILKFVSKRLLTREICQMGVQKGGRNLQYVPLELRDERMCDLAVQHHGSALLHVPPELKTDDMCLFAVSVDMSGQALGAVPFKKFSAERGRQFCMLAVRNNGTALQFVPRKWITWPMCQLAVESFYVFRDDSTIQNSYEFPIKYVPSKFMRDELMERSVEINVESVRDIPVKHLRPEICVRLAKKNSQVLYWLPTDAYNDELVNALLELSPRNYYSLPAKYRTPERLEQCSQRDASYFKKRTEEKQKLVLCKQPQTVPIPNSSDIQGLVPANCDRFLVHDLAETDSCDTYYYITDIHLEHQLDLTGKSIADAEAMIEEKVAELVGSIPEVSRKDGILLIGGDVSDSIVLDKIFYQKLCSQWRGEIVAILGNHELWDTSSSSRVKTIISSYRSHIGADNTSNSFFFGRFFMLENEVLVRYKGTDSTTLSESEILSASKEELSQIFQNSTQIILGGIGFSGREPKYNAAQGLYQTTITPEEDVRLTARFSAVYDKVLECAAERPVIVLSHTPMSNWSSKHYNSNWIYVSGHTHQNALIREENGAAVFADNQVGYDPKPWHFKAFTLQRNLYDPFCSLPEGIHPVSVKDYLEFNRGQGIYVSDMRHAGEIYLIKRSGRYLFLLKYGEHLNLLEGGRRHAANHSMEYFYENLPKYTDRLQQLFAPYFAAQHAISQEVKRFGGLGKIHGCIVDIDWFNHIYLNPRDGSISPYFAWDTETKHLFPDVRSLLSNSPVPPTLPDGSPMLLKFLSLDSPLLTQRSGANSDLAVSSELVLDRSMYAPSRIMRSIQYAFDQNVVRIWNDRILELDDSVGIPEARKTSTHLLD